MAIVVYPLNDIDLTAEDVGIYNATRTSGIYAGEDFAISMTGSDNTVSIDVGLAWMRLNRFFGVAVALKNKVFVDLGIPDSIHSRIDAVVLQFDANKNGAEVVVKSGAASSNPQPPVVSRTEALHELHLLHVLRKPGAASITAADVTDLRMDAQYCGLMADSVTQINTDAINAQAMALIEQLRAEISGVKDGSAFIMKSGDTMTGALSIPNPTEDPHAANKRYVDGKLSIVSVKLSSSGWSNSQQTVAVAKVTADRLKSDVLASPDPEDANYAAYIESGVRAYAQLDGAVTFKCEDAPSIDLTVNVAVRV